MFDAVRNNKRIVQVFLALIALPFAFFGVESYMRDAGANGEVARIGDLKVTQQHFQQALRDQQERLGARLGKVDPKLFDTPEARKAILNELIDQRVLMLEAQKRRLVVTDAALRQQIAAIDAFRVDGKFSTERYESELRRIGMNPASFEGQMRQDLVLRQLVSGVSGSTVLSSTVLDRLLALQSETRHIQEVRLDVDRFLDKVTVSDEDVRKFYEENAKQFENPEQVKVEYVVLGKADILPLVTVSEDEIRQKYEAQRASYEQPESRRASHLLLTGDKEKNRARAEELLQMVRKNPKSFSDLARKYSQDPGSADKGGDLGFFGRGMMVKPFEDAVFSLKEGEFSGVVESDFGWHIIQLTAIRPAKVRPLAEVRGEIEAGLKEAAVSRKFAEVVEGFTNLVYEQSDSLKPVAEKYKLSVRQADWMSRQGAKGGPLGHEKVLAALFSEDSLKNRRNIEAVEVGQNLLVSARVTDYKAAERQPLERVKGQIVTLLKRRAAQAMAVAEGEKLLAQAKAGEDKLAWGPVREISRLNARQVPSELLPLLFKADAAKLPAYVGKDSQGQGYTLVKIARVEPGKALEKDVRQALSGQFASLYAQEEFQNYLAGLKGRYKVVINQAALESAR